MGDRGGKDTLVRLGDGSTRGTRAFDLRPDAQVRGEIAQRLGLSQLRKLRLAGQLRPEGASGWLLQAQLGATVVQPCVVTLEPVTTRLDEDIRRLYLPDLPEPEAGETEMPEDADVELLPATLNLAEVMEEALALALPPYPRAPGVDPADITVAAPGVVPMSEEEVRPFAGLSDLRDRLAGEKDGDDG